MDICDPDCLSIILHYLPGAINRMILSLVCKKWKYVASKIKPMMIHHPNIMEIILNNKEDVIYNRFGYEFASFTFTNYLNPKLDMFLLSMGVGTEGLGSNIKSKYSFPLDYFAINGITSPRECDLQSLSVKYKDIYTVSRWFHYGKEMVLSSHSAYKTPIEGFTTEELFDSIRTLPFTMQKYNEDTLRAFFREITNRKIGGKPKADIFFTCKRLGWDTCKPKLNCEHVPCSFEWNEHYGRDPICKDYLFSYLFYATDMDLHLFVDSTLFPREWVYILEPKTKVSKKSFIWSCCNKSLKTILLFIEYLKEIGVTNSRYLLESSLYRIPYSNKEADEMITFCKEHVVEFKETIYRRGFMCMMLAYAPKEYVIKVHNEIFRYRNEEISKIINMVKIHTSSSLYDLNIQRNLIALGMSLHDSINLLDSLNDNIMMLE